MLQSFLGADYSGRAGDRIAQLVVEKIELPDVKEVDGLPATQRRGGFGSTDGCGCSSPRKAGAS